MSIIKLDATASTNTYLKNMLKQRTLEDYTTVVAQKQLNGKGQAGAFWESEHGKNLTMSLLKNFNNFHHSDVFLLTICASLAIFNALKQFSTPNLYVKWPNDILSGNTKICGILIENILVGQQIKNTIVGIGLNVNQIYFNTVSNATSMKLLLGQTFNLDELSNVVITELCKMFMVLENKEYDKLRTMYMKVLFRKDKPSTFSNADNNMFMGFIRGVSSEGKLMVEMEDAIIKTFDLKEIRLLY